MLVIFAQNKLNAVLLFKQTSLLFKSSAFSELNGQASLGTSSVGVKYSYHFEITFWTVPYLLCMSGSFSVLFVDRNPVMQQEDGQSLQSCLGNHLPT